MSSNRVVDSLHMADQAVCLESSCRTQFSLSGQVGEPAVSCWRGRPRWSPHAYPTDFFSRFTAPTTLWLEGLLDHLLFQAVGQAAGLTQLVVFQSPQYKAGRTCEKASLQHLCRLQRSHASFSALSSAHRMTQRIRQRKTGCCMLPPLLRPQIAGQMYCQKQGIRPGSKSLKWVGGGPDNNYCFHLLLPNAHCLFEALLPGSLPSACKLVTD